MTTDPSSDKLLEWNKEEIGLFEESKTKPSHLTSLATQEFEKRASKRQARKMSKSIKDHMTQTGSNQEALFKPHMNLNPLVEESSKAGSEEPKNDVDALNSKADPEVAKSKKTKKTKGETENVTAVVNEFFDEEEPPRGDGELPDLPPVELTTIDEIKDDTNERNEPDDNTPDNNDNTPDNNDKDTEPLITNDGENGTTQKPNIVSVDEDKATDMQPSPTSEDAPVSENVKAEEVIDNTAEVHTTTVNEEQTIVSEQEMVTTVTNEEDGKEGEVKGMNGDADNLPLIDVKKSTTKTPSSPGKFGLRVKLVINSRR